MKQRLSKGRNGAGEEYEEYEEDPPIKIIGTGRIIGKAVAIPEPSRAEQPNVAVQNINERLSVLNKLLADGILTQDEYNEKRKKIIEQF